MSNDGFRWVEGGVLGLALVAMGCNEPKPGDDVGDETDGTTGDGDGDTTGTPAPNDIPLELTLAAFNKTGQYLLLRFSEPMAPVDGVDPTDFRVSFAATWRSAYYGTVYAYTSYTDPNYTLQDPYYYGYNPLTPDLIVNGNMATDIVLRFANPMTAEGCALFEEIVASYEEYDSQPDVEARAAMFPHYSPGAVPVKSLDGETLAAIGADWVEHLGPYMGLYDSFGFEQLDPQISIPCGVEPQP